MVSAEEVLEFWFDGAEADPAQLTGRKQLWFQATPEDDATIRERFEPLLQDLAAGGWETWVRSGPKGRLGAIMVLDQFPRMIYRDTPKAFAFDALARQICKAGLDEGADRSLKELERWFFYMPLMHSEDLFDQERCVDLFVSLLEDCRTPYEDVITNALDFARRHRDVVAEFGRYPHRNVILGRDSTDEERVYLSQPGAGF